MGDIDFERIITKAKHYLLKRGHSEQESEDFAQECALTAFCLGSHINLEYCYLNYRDKHTANKRVLCSEFSRFTTSIDQPLTENGFCLSQVIPDTGDDLGDREFYVETKRIVESILSRVKNQKARLWALHEYSKWWGENVI